MRRALKKQNRQKRKVCANIVASVTFAHLMEILEPITSEPAEKKTPEPEVEEEPMHVEVDQSAIIDQSRITKLSGHTGEVRAQQFSSID